MTDYSKLVEALNRLWQVQDDDLEDWVYGSQQAMCDAAAAIEDLQKDLATLQKCYEIADTTADEVLKQLPKRGEWELIDGAEPMRWGCSRCKYLSWETSTYCPRCGAKMEVQDGQA